MANVVGEGICTVIAELARDTRREKDTGGGSISNPICPHIATPASLELSIFADAERD
jgi:hypothetical protein